MDYMLLKNGEVMSFKTEHVSKEMPALLSLHDGVGYYYTDSNGTWHGKMVGEPPSLGCATIPNEQVPDIIKLAAMLE